MVSRKDMLLLHIISMIISALVFLGYFFGVFVIALVMSVVVFVASASVFIQALGETEEEYTKRMRHVESIWFNTE